MTLTVDGDFERPPCALDRPEFAEIRFTVQGVQFNGLSRVPGLSLDAAWASYQGRELPVSVLCDIRAEANSILRRQGYLATVEIPEQSLADGIPDFNVVFGRLTAVRVRGDAGPSEKLVAGYLEKLTGQDVFNIQAAERYLLLADDIPGLDVRLSLRPAAGGQPGDLVGEIAVVRQRALADVNIQNLGSNAIGPFGGTLRGEFYDLTGLGDRTSITLFSTLDFAEQQTVRIGHDFRVGREGLRLGGQFTWSGANPSVGLAGLNIDSDTIFFSLFASYPLLRSRRHSLQIDTGFDYVDQDVTINTLGLTQDRARMIYARLDGEMMDPNSVLRAGDTARSSPSCGCATGSRCVRAWMCFPPARIVVPICSPACSAEMSRPAGSRPIRPRCCCGSTRALNIVPFRCWPSRSTPRRRSPAIRCPPLKNWQAAASRSGAAIIRGQCWATAG